MLQSVGALAADTSPSAVYQPAAQAVCGIGSVLCGAALLGGEPGGSRTRTQSDLCAIWAPCTSSNTPYLTQNEWTGAGPCTQAAKDRTMRSGGCGNHQQQLKGPAVARVRRLYCDGAVALDGAEAIIYSPVRSWVSWAA